VHYHECRRLSSSAVLEIDQTATPETYAAASSARDALLIGLTLANSASPTATEAPTAVPQPAESTPAPNPTADPACAGVPEWYAATQQRLKRFGELLTELGRAQQTGDTNKTYLIYLDLIAELDRVIPAQRDAPTPASAQDLNTQLVDALFRYQSAMTRFINALNDALGVTTAEIQQISADWDQAFKDLGQISRRIEDLAKGCGVTTTG
jgi:hypothetical protein